MTMYRIDFERDGAPYCRYFVDVLDAMAYALEVHATAVYKEIDGKLIPIEFLVA